MTITAHFGSPYFGHVESHSYVGLINEQPANARDFRLNKTAVPKISKETALVWGQKHAASVKEKQRTQ